VLVTADTSVTGRTLAANARRNAREGWRAAVALAVHARRRLGSQHRRSKLSGVVVLFDENVRCSSRF
jgi:hypothetical protein